MNKFRVGILALLLSAGFSHAQTVVVFSDDFENGATNWTFEGTSDESNPELNDGGLWHISAKVPTTNAVNGTTSPFSVSYGTNHTLHFGYEDHYGLTLYNPTNAESPTIGNSAVGTATSIPIDLTHVQNAQLTFRMYEHFDNGYYYWCSNGRDVGICVNGQWMTGFTRYAVLPDNQDADGWETVTVDLSDFYGSVIQIKFGIEVGPPIWDPSVDGEMYFPEQDRDRGDGWYINNVLVQGTQTP